MNWKRVDEHIEPTGYVPETMADKLKRTQEELGRHSKMALGRTIKASVLWCAFGAALGMTGMVYLYEQQPKPQPVVVERSVPGDTASLEAQIKALNAKIDANYTQQMTRQKEVRFKTEKLELAKQVHDVQLATAQEGADHIRQMAQDLGITRMRRVTP